MELRVGDRVTDYQGRRIGTVDLIGQISGQPHVFWDGETEPRIWPFITLKLRKLSNED